MNASSLSGLWASETFTRVPPRRARRHCGHQRAGWLHARAPASASAPTPTWRGGSWVSLRSYIGREPARLRAVRQSPFPGILAALALVWPLASCATGGMKFDLDPARTAVVEARQAGAPTRSAEEFSQAEKHL